MIKTTGAEFNAFYADKTSWPDGAWHDNEVITVNGFDMSDDFDWDKIPLNDKITIEGGIVLMTADATDGPSLEEHFKAWRKRQNTATLSVTVDKAKEAQLRELLKDFGAKIS